jgi:hypothetical protein
MHPRRTPAAARPRRPQAPRAGVSDRLRLMCWSSATARLVRLPATTRNAAWATIRSGLSVGLCNPVDSGLAEAVPAREHSGFVALCSLVSAAVSACVTALVFALTDRAGSTALRSQCSTRLLAWPSRSASATRAVGPRPSRAGWSATACASTTRRAMPACSCCGRRRRAVDSRPGRKRKRRLARTRRRRHRRTGASAVAWPGRPAGASPTANASLVERRARCVGESWYQLAGESPAWPKSSRQACSESCGRRGNAASEA